MARKPVIKFWLNWGRALRTWRSSGFKTPYKSAFGKWTATHSDEERARANTRVSPLRCKCAPPVEMTSGWGGCEDNSNSNDNDNSNGKNNCQYRGLSATAQRRAFGRDDRVLGWGEENRQQQRQRQRQVPIQGSLRCGASARLRSR